MNGFTYAKMKDGIQSPMIQNSYNPHSRNHDAGGLINDMFHTSRKMALTAFNYYKKWHTRSGGMWFIFKMVGFSEIGVEMSGLIYEAMTGDIPTFRLKREFI